LKAIENLKAIVIEHYYRNGWAVWLGCSIDAALQQQRG
jgi:hypothetical protein